MRRLFFLTLTLFLIARVQPAGIARGDEVADALLRLVPPDAGMTLLVENLQENARRFFESTISNELGALPTVRAWRASERGQGLQLAKRQIEKVIGEKIATLRDELLGDAFALVLHLNPDEMPDQAHGLLLARVRNKALLDRVIQEFNSAQIRKGEIARVVPKSWRGVGYFARVHQDPTRPTEFYATLDQTFAWSNSEKVLQGVLERHADAAPGLAQSDRFRRVRDKLPRNAALSLFVDAGFVRRSLAAAPQQKRSANEERVVAIFERYLGALEYAGAAVEWNDGIALQIEESLRADRLDPWIRAWADCGTKTNPDMLRVPSTALAVGNLYVDFPAFLQAVESVIPEEGRTKYGNLLEAMKGVLLGRDLRKEILPYLGPGVLAYLEAPQKGDSAPGLPFVVSVDVGGDSRVGVAIENALRTLLAFYALDDKQAAPGPTLQTQQIQGARVTSLRPVSPFAFTVTGGRLVLGRSPESVARACGQGPSSSLAALRAAYFPDKASFACFDLTALKSTAELHRTDLVKRLASQNRRSEEAQARDLDQVLCLIGLFRAAYVTSAMTPDATSVHRTAGLIARDPTPGPNR
ncbi:MAG: hypothetical protein P4L84_23450 [Isosphaeraceae bacterium]|nr:hypothetical protein [Isosphaeraceae bacterium]